VSLDELPFSQPEPDATRPERPPRTCLHPHRFRENVVSNVLAAGEMTVTKYTRCKRCGHVFDDVRQRRGRNNRARGGRAELVAARAVGGKKVGPLGQPWDVEMPGYARLQVRKYATPQSLRQIAAELARIGSGAEMPGYIWIEPGRGGERLIVFRLADFAERHGVEVE
jgi:hypothetical protein